MRYPVDIEVLADEHEERQQVLKEIAMKEAEIYCEQCGDGHELREVMIDSTHAECTNCGNVWKVYSNGGHGIPNEAWEYAEWCRGG